MIEGGAETEDEEKFFLAPEEQETQDRPTERCGCASQTTKAIGMEIGNNGTVIVNGPVTVNAGAPGSSSHAPQLPSKQVTESGQKDMEVTSPVAQKLKELGMDMKKLYDCTIMSKHGEQTVAKNLDKGCRFDYHRSAPVHTDFQPRKFYMNGAYVDVGDLRPCLCGSGALIAIWIDTNTLTMYVKWFEGFVAHLEKTDSGVIEHQNLSYGPPTEILSLKDCLDWFEQSHKGIGGYRPMKKATLHVYPEKEYKFTPFVLEFLTEKLKSSLQNIKAPS